MQVKGRKNQTSRKAGARPSGSAQKVVRYAVVGLGHIAQAAMLPAFGHAKRNSRLVALVSGSSAKLKSLGRRYRVPRLCDYGEAEALFKSGNIDAVYIALPNDLHKEWSVKAMRAGLHVLCEKPMAVTARDCETMIRAAAASGVKLMIAYRLHFEAANLDAVRQVRRGTLGDLRFFSSDFSMQVRKKNIRLKRAKGGGPLYDIGIYCINAARATLGEEPRAVFATATRSGDRRFREVEETVVAAMRFNDERLASFNCSFGGAAPRRTPSPAREAALPWTPPTNIRKALNHACGSASASAIAASPNAINSPPSCSISLSASWIIEIPNRGVSKVSRMCGLSKRCIDRLRAAGGSA